jgi:hypothetical protein
MLSRYDEYPIHQTAESLARPSTGDRNFYDRYFFNGFSRSGDLFFGAAMGLYPNRRVLDAAFSVALGGTQHSLHASRLAPAERGETRVGPIEVEVIEPFRALRVRVGGNPHGIEADLVYRARAPMIEEPRVTFHVGGRAVLDATRFTQHGTWEGRISVDGKRVDVRPDAVFGVRDRSWGLRPIGEPEGGAPGMLPRVFWLWAPVHFDDLCTLAGTFESEDGRQTHRNAVIVPVIPATGEVPVVGPEDAESVPSFSHRVCWQSGTRRAASAEVTLRPHGKDALTIALQPLLTFQMRGLGYINPEWGHGTWKGESALGAESWSLAGVDPLDPRNIHVQQLCEARMGERRGVGVLEQLALGPHVPSGFRSILDGAADGATSSGS